MSGWIKLHRQISESFVFDNPNLLKFWIWCLTKASHKKCTVAVGMRPVQLLPGQFVTGRKQAAAILKMSESMIVRCIDALKSQCNITVKSNSKFSVITICKWSSYQEQENPIRTEGETTNGTTDGTSIGQQSDSNRTAIGHKQEGKECEEDLSLLPHEVFSEKLLLFAREVIGLTPEGILTGWITVNGWTEDWVIEALQIATEKGKRGNAAAQYAAGIMRGWSKDGKPEQTNGTSGKYPARTNTPTSRRKQTDYSDVVTGDDL